MYSCVFIGHKDCNRDIKSKLFSTIENLIIKEKVSTFYVGTQGNYDRLVYEVLSQLKEFYEINIVVVLAYLNEKTHRNYFNTQNSLFPDVLENTPLRFAISRRNKYMIDNSQYMVCYMNDCLSNTYTYVRMSIKKRLRVINLGEYDIKNM